MAKIRQKAQGSAQAICTDGAKFSLKGFINQQAHGWRKVSNNIQLKYRHYGNPTFNTVAEVYLDSERVGEIEAHPRSLLDPDTVLFSVDNRIQYSKGWTNKIQKIWHDMQLDLMHVNRLDIAVDQVDQDQFAFIRRLVSGSVRSVGGTRFQPLYKGRDEKGRAKMVHFTFGSRKSGKYLRAYYKRQELEVSNKKYIEDYWQANGFNLDKKQEVARFEIVLKREELKRYEDLQIRASSLHLLEDPEYLATLFNTAKTGFFEFVRSSALKKDKNVSRAKRLKILDLSNITTRLLSKVRRKASSFVYQAKMAAKMQYMLYCKTGDDMHYKQVQEILKNFTLTRWFEAMVDRFYKEYQAKMAGSGFDYLKAYTSDPEHVQLRVWETHNFTA